MLTAISSVNFSIAAVTSSSLSRRWVIVSPALPPNRPTLAGREMMAYVWVSRLSWSSSGHLWRVQIVRRW